MKKNQIVILVLIILIIGGGLFYWYEYRPYRIKSHCYEESNRIYQNSIDELNKERDAAILAQTGATWEELFNCWELVRESYRFVDDKEIIDCKYLVYGDDEFTSYPNRPIDIAKGIDKTKNEKLARLRFTEVKFKNQQYENCLRAKGL